MSVDTEENYEKALTFVKFAKDYYGKPDNIKQVLSGIEGFMSMKSTNNKKELCIYVKNGVIDLSKIEKDFIQFNQISDEKKVPFFNEQELDEGNEQQYSNETTFNYIYKTGTLEFRKATPEEFITTPLNVKFDVNIGKTPTIKQMFEFINEYIKPMKPDSSSMNTFLSVLSTSILAISPKIFTNIYGPSSSNKTGAIDIISGILSECYCLGDVNQLRYDKPDLGFLGATEGKHLVLYDEVDYTKEVNDAKIKLLTNNTDSKLGRKFFCVGDKLKSYITYVATSQDKIKISCKLIEGLPTRMVFIRNNVVFTNDKMKLKGGNYVLKNPKYGSTSFKVKAKQPFFHVLLIYALAYFQERENIILYGRQQINNWLDIAKIKEKHFQFIINQLVFTNNNEDKVYLNDLLSNFAAEISKDVKVTEEMTKIFVNYLDNMFGDIWDQKCLSKVKWEKDVDDSKDDNNWTKYYWDFKAKLDKKFNDCWKYDKLFDKNCILTINVDDRTDDKTKQENETTSETPENEMKENRIRGNKEEIDGNDDEDEQDDDDNENDGDNENEDDNENGDDENEAYEPPIEPRIGIVGLKRFRSPRKSTENTPNPKDKKRCK